MKKILSMLLCLVMVVSIIPVSVLAEETTVITDNQMLPNNIPNSLKYDKFLERDSELNPEEWIDQPIFDENSSRGGVSLFSLGGNNLSHQYTVLCLDVSGSMYGTPLAQMKKAAIKFCEKLLSSQNNYVGIVKYASSASIACGFSNNIDSLKSTINSLTDGNMTAMNAGINKAVSMFDTLDDVYTKNIVIMSDGLPNEGSYSYDGHYSSGSNYSYCNVVYDTVSKLKSDYGIYTLGFFHDLSGSTYTFAQSFMSDLQNCGYYNVTNADNLEITFEGLASDILDKFAGGIGTKADPVLINTYAQLCVLSDIVEEGTDCAGIYFKLNKDIVANNTSNWSNGQPDASASVSVWKPIGSYSAPFKGNFDGGNYKISGLYTSENSYNALFGYVVNGSINNVQIIDSYIGGDNYLAGIASYIKNSTINNCIFNGKIYSKSGDYIGGIVSCADNSTIKNCENIGEVTGNNLYVGGIGAKVSGSTINSCTNTGAIKGKAHYVGGIAGFISNAKVLNFSNKAKISGNKNVGGICGKVISSDLSNGFNIGNISAKDPVANIAGIIENSTANNIYSTGTIDTGSWIHAMDDVSFDEMKSTKLFAVYGTNSAIVSLPTWESVKNHSSGESVEIPPEEVKKDAFLTLLNMWVEQNNSTSKYKKWKLKGSYPGLDYEDAIVSNKKVFDNFDYDNDEYSNTLALLSAKYSAYAYSDYEYNKIDEVFFSSSSNKNRLKNALIADGFNANSIVAEKKFKLNGESIDNSATFTTALKDVEYKGETRKLIAVVIRGTDGEQWYGNMDTTGTSYDASLESHHQSFLKAAQAVVTYIETYYTTETDNSIVLVTGHSRGAAIANLVAQELTENSHKGIDKDSIFAYCFATPNTTQAYDANKYPNIFSLTFADDFVPRFPLEEWGYTVYGQKYTVSAQKLYANKKSSFYKDAKKAMTLSEGREPDFNLKAVEKVFKHISETWKNLEESYNAEPEYLSRVPIGGGMTGWVYDYVPETLHMYDFLHDYLAPAMVSGTSTGESVNIISKITSPIYAPAVKFLVSGKVLNKYLNDNHQMYTYYCAVKNNCFTPVEEANGISLFSLASVEESEYNTSEITVLKDFIAFEDNASLLDCDAEDVSTWDFVTWENGNVTSIDLYYKGCTGTLDLTGFEYLTSVDVCGNELTALDVSGCTSLQELYCANNLLTTLDINGVALTALDCSGNYLDITAMQETLDALADEGALLNYENQNVPENAVYNSEDLAVLSNIYTADGTVIDISEGGVVWGKKSGEYRVISLDISEMNIANELILILPALEMLDCSENQLTSLDISACVNLKSINCSSNLLTDIYGLTGTLEAVLCSNNQLDLDLYADIFEEIEENGGIVLAENQLIDESELDADDLEFLTTLIDIAEIADVDSVSTWDAIEWKKCDDGMYHIVSLNLNGYETLTGVLDVSSLTYLETISAAGTSITELYLPETVIELNDFAFAGCEALTDVYLPSALQEIGNNTFANCTTLSNIELTNAIATIGNNAFLNCETLRSVYVPLTVESIGDYAYGGCNQLMNVYFIGGIPSVVGENIFEYCSGDLKIYCFEDTENTNFSYSYEIISPLSIKSYPDKLIYEPNEEIDLTGLTLEYIDVTDGTIKDITDGWSVDYDFSQVGNAMVTISYLENEVSFDVVVRVAVTGVTLDVDSLALEYLEEYSLIATVSPENATDKEVVWYTSDENVATVDENGKVQGVGSGDAVIWVETVDGNFSAECEVSVHVAVQGVDFQEKDMQIYVGEEYEIPYYFTPSFPTYTNVSIEVDNPEIADVVLDDGFVYLCAYDAGFVNITITTEEGAFSDTLQLCIKYPKMKVIADEAEAEDIFLHFTGTAIGNRESEYIVGVDYGKSVEEVEQRKNTYEDWIWFSSYGYRAEQHIWFSIVAKPSTTYYYRMFAYNPYEDKYYWDDIKTVTTSAFELPSQTITAGQNVEMTAENIHAFSCTVEEDGLYSINMLTEDGDYAYLYIVDSEFNRLVGATDSFGNQQNYLLDAGETIYIYASTYLDGTYTLELDKSSALILNGSDNASTTMYENDVCYISVDESGMYCLRSYGDADLELYDEYDNQVAHFWTNRSNYLYLEEDVDYYLVADYMWSEYTELDLYKAEIEKSVTCEDEFVTTKDGVLWKFIPEETGFYTVDILADIPDGAQEYYCYAGLLLKDYGSNSYYSTDLSYFDKLVRDVDEEGNPIYEEYSGQRCELLEKGQTYCINTGYYVYNEGEDEIVANMKYTIRQSQPTSLNVGQNEFNEDMMYDYVAFTPKSSGDYRIYCLDENGEFIDDIVRLEYLYQNEDGEYVYDYIGNYGNVWMWLDADVTYYMMIKPYYYWGVSKLVIEQENASYLPENFNATEITSESTEISIATPGEILYFTFSPDVIGDYSFTTEGNCDTMCTLYDEDNDFILTDYDGGENYNFNFVKSMKKDEKCTLGIELEDPTETGTFTLKIEREINLENVIMGDVNGDGEVDFADGILILKHDVGLSNLVDDKLIAGDVNDDGEVDFSDAILVLKFDVGLITSFKR